MTAPIASPAPAIDDVKGAQPSRLAMEIAVHMEVHAALSTTTQAKAREIDALLAADRLIITPSQHTGWGDEAVEAAMNTFTAAFMEILGSGKPHGHAVRSAWRAALSAASSIAPATGFEVAKLEWEDSGEGEWTAETITGSYYLPLQTGDVFNVLFRAAEFQSCLAEKVGEVEAKAIAQAHFEAAIRSSISPSVSKESGEPS